MLGSPFGLLPKKEIERLSNAWMKDNEELEKELGADSKEVIRAKCRYVTWLFYQQQESIDKMREIHDLAREKLGHSDNDFLSFANAHTQAQFSRPGDDPNITANLYADVIDSLDAIHGSEAAESILPEYVLALHRAGKDDEANVVAQRYLDARTDTKTLPFGEIYKLNLALEGLAKWSVTNSEMISKLQAIRDAHIGPSSASANTNKSLLELQGTWVSRDDDGSSMRMQVSNNRVKLSWLDKSGNVTRGLDAQISARTLGVLKIIEVTMFGSPMPVQTVPYRFQEGDLVSAAGFDGGPTTPRISRWKKVVNQPSKDAGSKPVDKLGDEKHLWQGTLDAGAAKLRLRIEAEKQADGSYKGVMISVDQNNSKLLLDTFEIDDRSMKFAIKQITAKFEGELNDAKDKVKGTFTQGVALPFEMERVEAFEQVKPPNRPQTPKKPYPYTEEEVRFPNKQQEIVLAATLTIPRGEGPFPAAILISGSGPQDRDETLLNHKPFWVIADHLTRNGIAVLRYDDRGTGDSTGTFAEATSADFATDAAAAVEFLLSKDEIDNAKIGLIGHSEGGLIAPMVAVDRDDIAYAVLLAGPGIDGKQVSFTQSRAMMIAEGTPESAADVNDKLLTEIFAAMDEKGELLEEDIEKAVTKYAPQLGGDAVVEPLKARLQNLTGPWMKFFLNYDPAPNLKKTKCPVLALNGEKDTQVLVAPNLDRIKKSLEEGGNPDFEVRALPNLNHLFQNCETGGLSEYFKIEETFDPKTLEMISDWILERFGT